MLLRYLRESIDNIERAITSLVASECDDSDPEWGSWSKITALLDYFGKPAHARVRRSLATCMLVFKIILELEDEDVIVASLKLTYLKECRCDDPDCVVKAVNFLMLPFSEETEPWIQQLARAIDLLDRRGITLILCLN